MILVDILGLPEGLNYLCSSDGCAFVGGSVNCNNIYGSTNEIGTHELTLLFDGHTTILVYLYLFIVKLEVIIVILAMRLMLIKFIMNHSYNKLYNEWDGELYSESGVYTNNYVSVNGCDSVVTLDLKQLNNVVDTQEHCDTYLDR